MACGIKPATLLSQAKKYFCFNNRKIHCNELEEYFERIKKKIKSNKPTFNVNLCVFCQKNNKAKHLSQIMAVSISTKFRLISNINSDLREKIVDGNDVPLPFKRNTFIYSWENKHDLTNYLLIYVINKAKLNNVHLVTSGGFSKIISYDSPKPQSLINSTNLLTSNHEEADTRILLHILLAKSEGFTEGVINCKDTDVLVLLLHFKKYLI